MKTDWSTTPEPLHTILVATDFSEYARYALKWAMELARIYHAKIVLVHAIEPHPFRDSEQIDRLLGDAADARLTEESKSLNEARLSFATLSVHGKPWRVIYETATKVKADLIVIGSGGLNAIARTMIGSTADRVIRAAPAPVLTVHPDDPPPALHTMLAATDLSDGAEFAIRAALRLAQRTPDVVRLIFLHASPPPYVIGAIEAPVTLMPNWNEIDRLAQQSLDEVARAIRSDRLEVEPQVVRGYPARVILEQIREYRPDIVVLGTHGATGIDRLLLGSVAERVLHHATCPVLTVRTPSRELIVEAESGHEISAQQPALVT